MCLKAINNLYFTKTELTGKQNTESTEYIKINVSVSVVEFELMLFDFNVM